MSSQNMQVLFIDTVDVSLFDRLQQAGFQCVDVYEATADFIRANYNLAVGIVVRSRFPINSEFISEFPSLQFIARFGAGMENIDVAFVCMNLPYTMTVESAADAVIAFKPKKVFPYHYRGTDGLSDIEKFKELVESSAVADSIDVVQLNWYPNRVD